MTERGYDVYTDPEYRQVNSELTKMSITPVFDFFLAMEFGLSLGLMYLSDYSKYFENIGLVQLTTLLAATSLVMIPVRIKQARQLLCRRNEMLDTWHQTHNS